MMNEFDLIRRLTGDLPRNDSVVVGAGDDCAVLDLGLPDRVLLFKTDAVVEGVHFTGDADAGKVGHKAIARCLSDIAAMAGTPSSAVVTLALPPRHDADRIAAIYDGIKTTAAKYGVPSGPSMKRIDVSPTCCPRGAFKDQRKSTSTSVPKYSRVS